MVTHQLYLLLVFGCVNGRTFNRCQNYVPTNKENIRNCLDEGLPEWKNGSGDGEDVDSSSDNLASRHFSSHYQEEYTRFPYEELLEELHNLSGELRVDNDTLKVTDSEVTPRKMKTTMSNMLQYMLVPGFLMAGILPWIMPKLQMIVMMLSMVNNMAFSSALFTLVRSYVFDKEPEEHIIYVNNGYKNGH